MIGLGVFEKRKKRLANEKLSYSWIQSFMFTFVARYVYMLRYDELSR